MYVVRVYAVHHWLVPVSIISTYVLDISAAICNLQPATRQATNRNPSGLHPCNRSIVALPELKASFALPQHHVPPTIFVSFLLPPLSLLAFLFPPLVDGYLYSILEWTPLIEGRSSRVQRTTHLASNNPTKRTSEKSIHPGR